MSSSVLNHSNLPCGIIYFLIFVPNSFSEAAMECVRFSTESSWDGNYSTRKLFGS